MICIRFAETLLLVWIASSLTLPVASRQDSGQPGSSAKKRVSPRSSLLPKKTQKVYQLGEVIAEKAAICKTPDQKGRVLCHVTRGTYLVIAGSTEGYYIVSMGDRSAGYIPQGDVRITEYEVVTPTRAWQTLWIPDVRLYARTTRYTIELAWNDDDGPAGAVLSVFQRSAGRAKLLTSTRYDAFGRFRSFRLARHRRSGIEFLSAVETTHYGVTDVWYIPPDTLRPKQILAALGATEDLSRGIIVERKLAKYIFGTLPAGVHSDDMYSRRWTFRRKTRSFVASRWKRLI